MQVLKFEFLKLGIFFYIFSVHACIINLNTDIEANVFIAHLICTSEISPWDRNSYHTYVILHEVRLKWEKEMSPIFHII